jgi:hypothetical protein
MSLCCAAVLETALFASDVRGSPFPFIRLLLRLHQLPALSGQRLGPFDLRRVSMSGRADQSAPLGRRADCGSGSAAGRALSGASAADLGGSGLRAVGEATG